MNKEITIYELLGLIKDDKIKSGTYIIYYNREHEDKETMYVCLSNILYKLETKEIELNDKVEILEEDKDIEELKIENDNPTHFYIRDEKGTKCGMTKHSKMIAEKLNEIIREVNKLRSKEQ